MKILVVDNYDSFTYNLVHYLEALDVDVTVVYNDHIDFQQVEEFDKIVLSPGPGLPHQAGQMNELIARYVSSKPILGICLGFQALVIHFGGQLFNQDDVKHGVTTTCVLQSDSTLFKNTAQKFQVGLYHSWAADVKSMPKTLKVTALSKKNVIMSFEHRTLPIFGVQFHPESILSEFGREILENFIQV